MSAGSQVPSLVGHDGYLQNEDFQSCCGTGKFPNRIGSWVRCPDDRVKQLAGTRLTHLDSQGNRHLDYFDLF